MMLYKMKQNVKRAKTRRNWKRLRQKLPLVKDLEKNVLPPGLPKHVWITGSRQLTEVSA